MDDLASLLAQALLKNNLVLSQAQQHKLIQFLDLLCSWNRVFNLTAIKKAEELVYLHLMDSLSALAMLQGEHCLDVGSGGGLPGIPLAIVDPSKSWVLLDKSQKKTVFLTQVISELTLSHVKVVHARCEDFQPTQRFDSILSRAFASLPIFVEATAHLLAADGRWIAMKGKYPQAEIAGLPADIVVEECKRVAISGIQAERHLIVLRKKQQISC